MRIYKRRFILTALFCGFATWASASPIVYDVTVDTSSISGTTGSLDFNFNPGGTAYQAASLQVLDFGGSGTLAGSPMLTGDASGALPATVTFDNGTGFNDYFQDVTYGSILTFQVSLYGPALSSPDGVSTSGSNFRFGMFSDAAGTVPVLTTDTTDGIAFEVDVNLDGTTKVTPFSSETSVMPEVAGSAVPEPGCMILVGAAAIGLGALRLRRQEN